MAKHYTFFAITPTSDSWLRPYLAAVPQLVAKHGGRYIVAGAGPERVEGEPRDSDPAAVTILEWPSKQAETAFMTDPEYAPHLRARLEGGVNDAFSVPGVD